MFFACGIWCLADVSSVSPSSETTIRETTIQRTRPRRKTVFFKTSLRDVLSVSPSSEQTEGLWGNQCLNSW